LGVFREGPKEAGYVEGQNVAIEYRWAQGKNGRLPALAAELVERHVTVIVAGSGTPGAVAAKAATTTIPIVFAVAVGPIKVGFVASLNRPGGNLTGVTNLNVEIGPKRLELLHALLPTATVFAVLVDPTGPALTEPFLRAVQMAARTLGLQLHVLNASSERDFDSVFGSLVQFKAAALIIGPSTNFVGRTEQLAALAIRNAVPAIYQFRPFVAAGGLMSYGTTGYGTPRQIAAMHKFGSYWSAADMPQTRGLFQSGVNDPLRKLARPKSCTAQVLTWSALSGMLRAFRMGNWIN
jgi:putative tryptophan/tyrosine transport system substrate-binding protein